MRRLLLAVVILLPVIAFVAVLPVVERYIDRGSSLTGVGIMLAALAVMAAAEGLLFRYIILPRWGQSVSERLYAGTYTPDSDPLAVLCDRIRNTHDAALLPQLEKQVQRECRRVRAWQELANIRAEEFGDPEAAVAALQQGCAAVRPAEDRAMLLYRAAGLCENRLNDRPRALSLYSEAARRFPRTVYGRKAAEHLPG